jgi:hypothetical protein
MVVVERGRALCREWGIGDTRVRGAALSATGEAHVQQITYVVNAGLASPLTTGSDMLGGALQDKMQEVDGGSSELGISCLNSKRA